MMDYAIDPTDNLRFMTQLENEVNNRQEVYMACMGLEGFLQTADHEGILPYEASENGITEGQFNDLMTFLNVLEERITKE